MASDFFTSYLDYTSQGEVPTTFHRWSAIAGIGALLERNTYIKHGHSEIHANTYSMLIGNAGTRKSTAIKLIKKLLIAAGYTNVAAERTSKEKYLADLAAQCNSGDDLLEQNLFGMTGNDSSDAVSSFIAADEANDFFGVGNIEFLSLLGSLWDWSGKYENKIKNGKSDFIPNPTISILSGNTPTGFSLAFPSTVLGQGFFSRILLVYGEPSGKRITFPKSPAPEETAHIVKLLQAIRANMIGELEYSPGAKSLLDAIYQEPIIITDVRFESYFNRRLTHLLKLCIIVTAAKIEKIITEDTVIQANTYLTYVESLMPKALGEFGKSKDSEVSHKVLNLITSSLAPVTLQEIWKSVSQDIDKLPDLGAIIHKLVYADKIQSVGGAFIPNRKLLPHHTDSKFVDYSLYLTPEELGVKA